jgi:IPT/TIG domain
MNRATSFVLAPALSFFWFTAGCGGGPSGSSIPPPQNPVPAINTVNPATVVAGSSATPLDVTGSNFISSSVIAWNGTALATTFVSATELKATLPAADLTGSSASQITVQNPAPGGGSSMASTFTVTSPVPAITAISPRYVPPGSAATITITGTGFESNSAALWNTAPRPTTFVSATTLTVALSASDLQNQGTGALTVSNPAPGASTSPASTLTVTSTPVPVIQSATISTAIAQSFPAMCSQLEVTLIGTNFALDSTVQANGVSLTAGGEGFAGGMSELVAYFPAGFVSAPGALSFTVTNPDGGPIVSNPFPYPSTSPSALALCASPSAPTVYAPSSFSITVQPTEVNIGGNGTLSLGTLPVGITWSNASVPLPPAGVTLHLQAASTTAAGPTDIALNGSAAGTTAQGNFNFTVSTGTPPAFGFSTPTHDEVGVPIGGSGSIQYTTIGNSTNVDYDITPSVSGLPPGTTASFSPPEFPVGQSVIVTLSAASSAPVTQNASVTLIGTPSAQVATATASFFADVTQPPGSLPGNRSDFVPTAGTPYTAVYDPVHNLIFSSNPSWNRVDVISNSTHKIVKSIPVRSPRGLDITQDNSTVWVQGASVTIWGINTTSLQASEYSLPKGPVAPYGLPLSFSDDRLLALSDGTLFVYFNDAGGEVGASAGIWNPQTNQMTVLVSGIVTGLSLPVRSGDGTRVYAPGSAGVPSSGMSMYTVSSKTLTTINSGTIYNPIVAVNQDGSELVLGTFSSMGLYDANLNLLGTLPGNLTGFGPDFLLDGGVLFSVDSTKIYEIGQYVLPAILTIDASNTSNLTVVGVAPTANSEGGGPASSTPTPFAMDATGMVLCVQNYGISFEDSTFYQNYAMVQPDVSGGLIYTTAYGGPLAGGTTSTLYSFPSLTPDVWFGQTRGTASVSQGSGSIAPGELTFTSPPSTTPGPVNVKFIYPDGETAFAEQLFSYSTLPEYAVLSGSSPNGGAPGQIIGFGLPQDASGGAVTVGSNTATITTTAGPYTPFSAEPIPSTVLTYTFPQGTPGWVDLQVSTPVGTGTLPKSIYYAKSVSDYSSSDSFAAVLFDAQRNQLYLSAGDHIDVFSTTSNQFVAPLTPVAKGGQKQFAGLALTPDGSQLLAADLMDGSLAIINPDSGSSSYIFVATAGPGINGCEVGPLYVGATSTATNEAFVSFGSLPAPSCPQSGPLYLVNLSAKTAAPTTQCTSGQSVDASADGNYIGFGSPPCIYSVQSSTYTLEPFPYGSTNEFGIAISGDANMVAANQILGDVNGNMLGSVAQPIALYGSPNSLDPPILLPHPRLNASGSLYYSAYQNYFEIVDMAHAILRMRFSLTEIVQSVAAPIAIDSGGRFVYLVTNQGLTVVDLGAAPLSIGHLSPQTASSGTQVTVRGSGFDSTITATVGGITASVTVTDQNTLTLTVPSASSGPHDIVLTRGDGEVYTLENGLVLP